MAEALPVLLAGATGDLGGRIAAELVRRGAGVRAAVRRGSAREKLDRLRRLGATIVEVRYDNAAELSAACSGASCVLSALNGLREVIVEAQSRLLDAAIRAGVPRYIPSDFCIAYATLPAGSNRNLELRREFNKRLDQAPIAATSVLTGMFADVLTGPAPIILFKLRRVLYWQDADQPMDLTTRDNVAAFTAAVALDASAPRILSVAGDTISARGLAALMSDISGRRFRLLRGGGLGTLSTFIAIARTAFPQRNELYPAWQGMQYLRNMFSGEGKLHKLDNDRYPDLHWTPMREVLSAH